MFHDTELNSLSVGSLTHNHHTTIFPGRYFEDKGRVQKNTAPIQATQSTPKGFIPKMIVPWNVPGNWLSGIKEPRITLHVKVLGRMPEHPRCPSQQNPDSERSRRKLRSQT